MIAPRFTVRWAPPIVAGLAARWIDADSGERERLIRIAHLIDDGLSSSPERKGNAPDADPHVRTWEIVDVEPPVRIAFVISPDDRVVDVLHLTLYDRF